MTNAFDEGLARAIAEDPGFGTDEWVLSKLGAHFDEMLTTDQLADPRIADIRAEVIGQQVGIVNLSTEEGVK